MMQGAPRFLVIFCSFCAGMLAGACVGAIIGAAKIKLQVNEVVVAIMLNYIIQYFTSYIVTYPLKQEGAMTAQTVDIGANYMLTKLIPKTQLTTALLVAVAAGIAVAVLANNHPMGILLSALLFGILEAGSMKMSYSAGISTSMVNVIQGLVILFVATPNIIRLIKRKKGES